MTADDVERVAREIWNSRYAKDGGVWAYVETKDVWYAMARAALSAMPQRELLADALEALEPFAGEYEYWVTDIPEQLMLSDGNGTLSPADIKWGSIVRARAAADKIRAALDKGEPKR